MQPTSQPKPHSAVVLLLKAPRSGEVKTRLARSIGAGAALRTYRALVERQCQQLPRHWHSEVHYSPPAAAQQMQQWLGQPHQFYPQADGDLGVRLREAITAALQRGAKTVICIGGDCPQLQHGHFEQALAALNSDCDVVFGPSEDGGYYLIGVQAPHPQLFDAIPWSCDNTLAASFHQAARLGLRVQCLATLYDIDELPELQRAIQAGCLPPALLAP